jgi:hypothetical protein
MIVEVTMEDQILAAYSKYIEPYYGPISEESKKTIANLVEIAKSFDFLPLKIDGKQGEVIVTLADTDPRFKDGGFNKSQGTIAITKDRIEVLAQLDKDSIIESLPSSEYASMQFGDILGKAKEKIISKKSIIDDCDTYDKDDE